MEYLNKVELHGRIGELKLIPVKDRVLCQLSLKTEYCYTRRDGTLDLQVDWHSVSIWGDSGDFDGLAKGNILLVRGRLHSERYTRKDGISVCSVIVIANDWKLIEED